MQCFVFVLRTMDIRIHCGRLKIIKEKFTVIKEIFVKQQLKFVYEFIYFVRTLTGKKRRITWAGQIGHYTYLQILGNKD